MEQSEKTLDMIVNLCKNRGYVFPGSEIYGGLANSWDYGPLGVEFKNNVKKAWLKKFVQEFVLASQKYMMKLQQKQSVSSTADL